MFSPVATVNPVGFDRFTGARETKVQFVTGRAKEIVDDFRTAAQPHRALEDSWLGATSFRLSSGGREGTLSAGSSRAIPSEAASSSGPGAVHSALPVRGRPRGGSARVTQTGAGGQARQGNTTGLGVVQGEEDSQEGGHFRRRTRRPGRQE